MNLKLILIIIATTVVILTIWYFDLLHEPVETVDELIGENYDYALTSYFRSEPSMSMKLNINNPLYGFQRGILSKKDIVRDSIVRQYTWTFLNNHKTIIWVGKTDKSDNEIIYALRYRTYGVKF